MKNSQSRWLCSVAAAGLLVSQSSLVALAQDIESLGEIVVTGNYNGDRFAEAADRNSSIYISESAVKKAESGDLKDLFSEEASVTVGGAMPIAQKVYVNGVDMLNLNVSIDGAMQNNRAFHHVSANAIDPGLLKAVRVDAGIAAADSGPNAIAGSVAFETKDALDLLTNGENIGATVVLSADSNSKTISEALTAYGAHDGFDILGYVKHAKGQDYETGAGNTINGTAADLLSGMGKLGYTAQSGDRFEIAAQVLQDVAMRPFRANFASLPSRPDQTTRLYDTVRKTLSFNYFTEAPDGHWDPEVVIGFSENVIKVPSPYESDGTSSTFNAKIANTFHFGDRYGVTVGGDFYNKRSNYFGPATNLTEESKNLGVFAQARFNPFDPLKLSFGTRYDAEAFEGVNGQSFDVSGLSGNASVAYELLNGLTLKAGYSNIFGGIALEDNYTFDPNWDYTGIKPSRSENITAGFEAEHGGFTLSGQLFHTDVENARSSVYNYRSASMTRNNVDFVSKGFNVGLGYRWDAGFAKLTYSKSDIEVDGDTADSYAALDLGAPLGDVFALTVQHRFMPYNLTVGGNVDWALDYDTGAQGAEKTLKGYTAVNVFAEYEPEQIEGLSVRLAVNNLFDADYADRGTYGGEYNSVNELKEPGRSFHATLRYAF